MQEESNEKPVVKQTENMEKDKVPLTDTEKEEYLKLLELEKNLDEELENLKAEENKYTSAKEIVERLHDYNNIKDAAQIVLGELARMHDITIASLHKDYCLPTQED